MSKHLVFALSILAALLGYTASSYAQIYFPPYPHPHPYPDYDPNPFPVEFGGYLAAGGAGLETPPHGGGIPIGAVGLYGQWSRTGFCPGLDIRVQGNEGYLHGMLVGPRLAYQPAESSAFRAFHPYAEALFGPNEFPVRGTALIAYPPSHRGVTSAAVIGIDLDIDRTFRWRVIEFTKDRFTGVAGSQPYTITTGIVLHLP